MNKIEDIESYVGIPYVDRGRSKQEGYDCWGILLDLVKQIHGFELPDPEYIINTPEDAMKLFQVHDIYKWVDPIPLEEIRYGDVVAMRGFALAQMPYHVGVCVGGRKIIHAIRCGVVLQNVSMIKRYIIGVYRFKND